MGGSAKGGNGIGGNGSAGGDGGDAGNAYGGINAAGAFTAQVQLLASASTLMLVAYGAAREARAATAAMAPADLQREEYLFVQPA